MADRRAWLAALAHAADAGGTTGFACPDCGREQLEVRYIVDAVSRMGYVLFWCGACLHGITVSRVRAPEAIPVWPIDDRRSLVGVPEFIRHEK